MTIRFGTSGWRGILADDFGFDGVRAVSAAVARWASESGVRPRVVVAHDTRFLGDRFASVAARVLTAAGIRPIRPSGPVPTPVASSAVRHRPAAAGIIFTASHNPPEYQGLKVGPPASAGCRRIRFPSASARWRARFAGGRGSGWGSPPMGMQIDSA